MQSMKKNKHTEMEQKGKAKTQEAAEEAEILKPNLMMTKKLERKKKDKEQERCRHRRRQQRGKEKNTKSLTSRLDRGVSTAFEDEEDTRDTEPETLN